MCFWASIQTRQCTQHVWGTPQARKIPEGPTKWVWPKQQPSGKGSIHAAYASVDACKAVCLWLAMVFVCSHMCVSGICT